MNIENRIDCDGYFLMPCDYQEGACMVLTGDWKMEFAELCVKERIHTLRLSWSAGWRESEIEFLRSLHCLKGVEIYSGEVKSLQPLEELVNLEHCGLACHPRSKIDFSTFKNLNTLLVTWCKGYEGLEYCTHLKHLNMSSYPWEDFQRLQQLQKLVILKLISRKLNTFKSDYKGDNLKLLDLYQCTSLESLEGIEKFKKLEQVEIECCRRIHNIDPIGKLSGLRKLYLDDCGKIKSILPVKTCDKLETISLTGTTDVEDGDFSVIKHIPKMNDLRVARRRHYKPSMDEINELISLRKVIE